jgi:hypothetical protein
MLRFDFRIVKGLRKHEKTVSCFFAVSFLSMYDRRQANNSDIMLFDPACHYQLRSNCCWLAVLAAVIYELQSVSYWLVAFFYSNNKLTNLILRSRRARWDVIISFSTMRRNPFRSSPKYYPPSLLECMPCPLLQFLDTYTYI